MMCWIHPKLWSDGLTQFLPEKPLENILTLAVETCAAHVKNLLNCHALGDELRLEKWSDRWPQWSHYHVGTVEYEREKEDFLAAFRESYKMTVTA